MTDKSPPAMMDEAIALAKKLAENCIGYETSLQSATWRPTMAVEMIVAALTSAREAGRRQGLEQIACQFEHDKAEALAREIMELNCIDKAHFDAENCMELISLLADAITDAREVGRREWLEEINVLAVAGLCQSTIGGKHEFLKDIQKLSNQTPEGGKP